MVIVSSGPWLKWTDSGLAIEQNGIEVLTVGKNFQFHTFASHILKCSQVWKAGRLNMFLQPGAELVQHWCLRMTSPLSPQTSRTSVPGTINTPQTKLQGPGIPCPLIQDLLRRSWEAEKPRVIWPSHVHQHGENLPSLPLTSVNGFFSIVLGLFLPWEHFNSCESESVIHSVMSDSFRPHEL